MQKHSTLRLILIPAIFTLVVTALRLIGQVQGWNPTVFGTPVAGGGQALLGISWLIFVFGFYFGLKLERAGLGPARPGRAALWFAAALLAGAGCMFALLKLDLMWWPRKEEPGEPRGSGWMLLPATLATLVAFIAWGRGALTCFAYGICARLPVVAVTWLCIQKNWKTHYTVAPDGFPPAEGIELLIGMSMSQIVFWIPLTTIIGGLTACLGVKMARRG